MKFPRSLVYAAAAAVGIGGTTGCSNTSKVKGDLQLRESQARIEGRLDEYLHKAGVDPASVHTPALATGTSSYYGAKAVESVFATADSVAKLPGGFSEKELQVLAASQRVVNNARMLLATTEMPMAVMDDALSELADAVEKANQDNTNEAIGGTNPEIREWANDLAAAYRARIQHPLAEEE